MASSLELNKLLAGVLTAGIIGVGAAVFSGLLYSPRPLTEHAFSVVVADDAGDVADAEAVDEPSIAVLLASADASAGQAITRQCTACHVFDEGGDNRVGPYLWDVVGRDVASVSGFSYSAALQGVEGEWTFEALDGFLADPRGWAPGTSMSYAGLRSATDRANLIAYLREQSNDPAPLPEPEAETAEAAAEDVAAAVPVEEAAEAADEPAPVEEEVADAAPPAADEETETTTAVPEVDEERVVEAPEAAEEPAAAAEVVEEAPAADAEIPAVTEAEPAEELAEETGEAPTNGAEASPMVAMVAAADPATGERNFRQCAACHSVDQGGPNRVGPNLWGVFGADVGHHEGFNYSEALLSLEGIWTVDKLNTYLENPRAAAPGNRMAFAGIRGEEDRAAMIAYLRSLSEEPRPVDIQ
jgi:cytochrome c